MQLRILTQNDIKKMITMEDAIEVMRTAFSELDYGRTKTPLRTNINVATRQGQSLFMPAFLPELDQLGVKVASIFPNNSKLGLPSTTGTILLLDTATGAVKALLEGSFLTALRTGAVAGLATDLFAKPDAKSLTIIGSGTQARTQLQSVLAVRKIQQIFLYSSSHKSAAKFAEEIKNLYPDLEVNISKSIDLACNDADIICTVTNSKEPLLYLDDIKADCHINAIGSHTQEMHEIDISILAKAKIIVDQKSAALAEAGEIIRAVREKVINEDNLYELGYILNHADHFENLKQELTVFKSVGLAIQDLAVAAKVLVVAETRGIGQMVEL